MDRILIIGASGGLGEALVQHYAAPGRLLVLWGRNHSRLDHVAGSCRAAGAQVMVRSQDIQNVEEALAAVRADDDVAAFDLALLVAGSGDIRAPGALVEDPLQVSQLGLVNFVAPCALASALAERMTARRRGTIAFIGSAAGFHALPSAATYAASKAGLARFAEALRIGVAPHGVRVVLASPGFIDTAAGRRTPGPRPLQMQPAAAASRIARAVERGNGHVVLPWPFAALRVIDRLLPRRLRDHLLRALAP
jgi:short-subunit dehydrogenase